MNIEVWMKINANCNFFLNYDVLLFSPSAFAKMEKEKKINKGKCWKKSIRIW